MNRINLEISCFPIGLGGALQAKLIAISMHKGEGLGRGPDIGRHALLVQRHAGWCRYILWIEPTSNILGIESSLLKRATHTGANGYPFTGLLLSVCHERGKARGKGVIEIR